MRTRIDEIAPGIYRIASHTTDAGKDGLLYCQFLIASQRPLLYHTGQPAMFEPVRDAVATVIDPATIAYVSAAHASRPDEFGCLPEWLRAAPGAVAVHTPWAIAVVLRHLVAEDRLMPLRHQQQLDLGDRQLTFLHTPHVPFREAAMMHDPQASVLFSGDLFTVTGDWPPTTAEDLLAPAVAFEARMNQVTISPQMPVTLRQMAALNPAILAGMHAPAYTGNCAALLHGLAAHYHGILATAGAGHDGA